MTVLPRILSILLFSTSTYQQIFSSIPLHTTRADNFIFEQHRPRIQVLEVKTCPQSSDGFWVTLPKGPGSLDISLKTVNVNKTEFWIVPVGSETWKFRKYLGEGIKLADGLWKFTFHYGPEDLYNHIVIKLISDTEEADYTVGVKTKVSR